MSWAATRRSTISERVFALSDDRRIDERIRHTFIGEERRMPAAPHDDTLRVPGLDGPRDGKRVADRCAGQHRNAEAQGALGGFDDALDRVGLESSVDHHDLELRAIERRGERHQRQRHRVENRTRVVEDDARALAFHESVTLLAQRTPRPDATEQRPRA